MAVVSSRVGRPRRRLARWLRALSSTCLELDARRQRLISAPGTTAHPWLLRCHALFGTPLLQVESAVEDQAEQDALLLACADRVRVLGLRRGGNVWRALHGQFADGTRAAETVEFLAEGGWIARDMQRELLSWGARPWHAVAPAATTAATAPAGDLAEPVCVPLPDGEDWLTHCTRGVREPWPGQSENDFLDDWLLHPETADYSAEATLRRILEERRLRAGAKGVRGGAPVVSFTSLPPARLSARRVYRRHRRRWDFEPYGIAIRRAWLVGRGARPVRYGDDSLWQRLAAADRPFFQRESSGQGQLDWTVEREWRHVGDVLLADLPADQALVLVPDPPAARRLAPASPWPFAIFNEGPVRE